LITNITGLHIPQAARHRAIHAAVQGIEMFGLEARRIDENELGVLVGIDAMDTMARSLCLA
jgi:hypothetical protein